MEKLVEAKIVGVTFHGTIPWIDIKFRNGRTDCLEGHGEVGDTVLLRKYPIARAYGGGWYYIVSKCIPKSKGTLDTPERKV